MSDQPDPLAGYPVYTFADDDLLRELPAEQRIRLEQQISTAEYPAGHMFFAPEDVGEQVFLLRRGRVRLYKLSPEGRALTLMVLEPAAIFGEMALAEQGRHDSFAEAMTECRVGFVAREALREALRWQPAVTLQFVAMMSARLRAMEHKLADIAFKSVPQRLATVLLSLASTRHDSPPATTPAVVRFTHQQLAEMIGSYRETVTKTIGEFREAGLIRVEDEAIHLTDLSRLRGLAKG